MRIITGDECGLLKEIIPELCRPLDKQNGRNGTGNFSEIHAGRARPSATSIQAAAASYGNAAVGNGGEGGVNTNNGLARAVRRLEMEEEAQSRERGVVSLSFLPKDVNNDNSSDDGSSSFSFAALRMNGSVETWSATRDSSLSSSSSMGFKNSEVNVTAATYRKVGGCNVALPDQKGDDESDEENESSSHVVSGDENGNSNNTGANSNNNRGWYSHQPIRPIGMVSNYNTTNKNSTLITCDSIGTLNLLNPSKFSSGIVETYNAFDISPTKHLANPSSSKNNRTNAGTLTYTKGGFANVNIATCLAIDPSGKSVAVGGRERGVRILDLECGKLLWKAKNLPPDPQTLLQQPMWTTTMQFLHSPTTSSSSSTDPTNLLATGTAYKQVQIYDIRQSSTVRRPVLYTPDHLLSHRITTLCQLHDSNTLAVADSIGDCHLLDLRKMSSGNKFNKSRNKAKEEIGLGRLVGPGGSIRQLALHPTLPHLACVGLDRKLWTWDVSRRKMMDCVYLRQRLNSLLFCEDESWDYGMGEEEEEDGGEGGMYEYDGEGGSGTKRERELDEVEDEVQDYVDSSEEEEDGKDVRNGDNAKQKDESSSETGSEETASDSSEEEDGDDSDGDEESTSSSEEEEASRNAKKRRKK
eukprot:CAMPEP_0183721086 /NCGR_PEP_ID=MMETSP0737-20130205/13500_1 /TAXON_ID=385413 /ORGANISM="Thalassiosira miniscula, Strain CCMP1093" /LENGTH=638 /DNA_ID=CAMNT_0025951057 /DNA_START=95 /DNA_END=2011 /DNA_ORIENTATION=+